MKKAGKLLIIISLSVAAVGLVFLVAGCAMGATINEANVLLGTTGYTEIVEEKVVKISDDDDIMYADGSYMEYPEIHSLDVDVTGIEVLVRESGDENLRIQTDGMPQKVKDELSIYSDDGELEIELDPKRVLKNWLKNAGDVGTLIIELPKDDTLEEISIAVGEGVLTAERIDAKELDIKVGAGAAAVEQVSAQKINVGCGAGEVELAGTVYEEMEIECGVGAVTFHDSGKESDYDYKISCGIGQLQIGESVYRGVGHQQKIESAYGDKKMEIECGIGEVNVTFQ